MENKNNVKLYGMNVVSNPPVVSKVDGGKGMPVVPNKPQAPKPSTPKPQTPDQQGKAGN